VTKFFFIPMTTSLHSDWSCPMMMRVSTSTRYHSFMSSIHSLLGLPLLFCPTIIPNITFNTNQLLPILQMCPNNFSFLSVINCTTFCFCQSFFLSLNSLFSAVGACGWRILLYILFQMPSASPCPGLTCI